MDIRNYFKPHSEKKIELQNEKKENIKKKKQQKRYNEATNNTLSLPESPKRDIVTPTLKSKKNKQTKVNDLVGDSKSEKQEIAEKVGKEKKRKRLSSVEEDKGLKVSSSLQKKKQITNLGKDLSDEEIQILKIQQQNTNNTIVRNRRRLRKVSSTLSSDESEQTDIKETKKFKHLVEEESVMHKNENDLKQPNQSCLDQWIKKDVEVSSRNVSKNFDDDKEKKINADKIKKKEEKSIVNVDEFLSISTKNLKKKKQEKDEKDKKEEQKKENQIKKKSKANIARSKTDKIKKPKRGKDEEDYEESEEEEYEEEDESEEDESEEEESEEEESEEEAEEEESEEEAEEEESEEDYKKKRNRKTMRNALNNMKNRIEKDKKYESNNLDVLATEKKNETPVKSNREVLTDLKKKSKSGRGKEEIIEKQENKNTANKKKPLRTQYVILDDENERKQSDETKAKKVKQENVSSLFLQEEEEEEEKEKTSFKIKEESIKLNYKQENSLDADLQKETKLSLVGCKVVFTGVFNRMSREQIVDKAKEYGCLVMSSVSSKTDFLIHGNVLEDGRAVEEGNKYKKALSIIQNKDLKNSKKCTLSIIDEDKFLDLIDEYKLRHHETAQTKNATGLITQHFEQKAEFISVEDKHNQSQIHTLPQTSSSLWTEKYRPKDISEIIGNAETVKKLKTWLEDWNSVCILGKKKSIQSRKSNFPHGGFLSENVNARCALISGPPGIGKTSAAKVVAHACNFHVLEFNASDERNQSAINGLSDMLTGGYTLGNLINNTKNSLNFSKSNITKNTCIIFDEVDGLSAGDRGGSQAILKLIDKTMCPIICICNDRMNTKVRSIANKSYDLRFSRPLKTSIVKRVVQIAKLEGLVVQPNSIEILCENVGNDIRQILNTLEFMLRSERYSKEERVTEKNEENEVDKNRSPLTYALMKEELKLGSKDLQVMLNPFDVTKKLLTYSESKQMNPSQKLDAFFVDYDIIPLLIQENFLSAIDRTSLMNEDEKMDNVCIVCNDFVYADMLSRRVMAEQHWSLLSDIATFSALDPSFRCKGFLVRPEFPRWFGKNSTTNKNRRLLSELYVCLSSRTTCSNRAVRLSGYLELLYDKCVLPLLKDDEQSHLKVETTIKLLDEYSLTKQALLENITSLRLKCQDKLYDSVNPKIKSLFTREYNNTSHNVFIAPSILRKAGKSTCAAIPSTTDNFGDAADEDSATVKDSTVADQEEQDNEDDAAADNLIVERKKKTSSKNLSKSKKGENILGKSTKKKK